MRKLILPLFSVLIILLCSCAAEREKNLNNIQLLRKDMTKAQAKAVMGEPLVGEVYSTDNIWYYYTERKWMDCSRTRDECTPLVFKDDKLLGWGHPFLKKYQFEQW